MNKLGRNDPCWCGSGKKYKNCHEHFDEEIERFRLEGHVVPKHEMIKTPEQIQGIRDSSKINIAVLDAVAGRICEGMSTEEIDRIVADTTAKAGAIAAPLNYEGFPKSVCTSVNSQVCHGIPSEKDILKDGDIVNVDVSTIYKGYYSDSSRMFCIGNVNEERRNVVDTARACMEAGIEQARPWQFLGDIAQAIQDVRACAPLHSSPRGWRPWSGNRFPRGALCELCYKKRYRHAAGAGDGIHDRAYDQCRQT
jgi:methionyl aminopeptidase